MSTLTSSDEDDFQELMKRLTAAVAPILTDPLNPYSAAVMADALRAMAASCDVIAAQPFVATIPGEAAH